MSRPLRFALATSFFLVASHARGQSAGSPVIFGVNPPGATVGQAEEWSIAGRNLGATKRMYVSGTGVEVVEFASKGETAARAKVRVAADATPGYREVRLDGPNGISNLAIVRVDPLRQVIEVDSGGDPSRAQVVEAGSAVVGLLKPLDLDHYRIRGTPGRRLTLDLEARRVGTSIAPVMTILSEQGVALAQAREMKGGDRDCRMTTTVPPEGSFLVQVRDNTYAGNELAHYRLRVDPGPFATASYPLGGRKGEIVAVEVSGGNLAGPIRKSITLPDTPGSTIEIGLVDEPNGPIPAPGRLLVGDGPEMAEPPGRPADSTIELTGGVTVNGRIAEAGEVDAYRIRVKAGERVQARIEAAAMGSWLDSVLTVRDDKGQAVAENDDGGEGVRPDQARSVNALGVPEGSPDSSVEFEAKADGLLTVEVTDRFGDGGPEYGYRLSVGPARPDFSVTLLLGNANAAASALGGPNQGATTRTSPGQFGLFNLKPGGSTPINFLVSPEGRPGPVDLRVEGLPEGVTAEPVVIRLAGPPRDGATPGPPASAVADFLLLKVAPYTPPGLGEIRVVATARPMPGVSIVREATATIGVATAGTSTRPITRVISRVPVRVVGEARPRFVGPPAPPTLKKVTVPGPLLQGDRLDLALDFDRSVTADDGSTVEAVAEGFGLATNTVISAGTTVNEEDSAADVVVHVLASTKAQPGPHPVRVTYTPPGGPATVREVTVEVLVPIEVKPKAEAIFLAPGDSATVPVEIRREAGFEGEVEVRVEGLPRGIKTPKPADIPAGKSSAEVRLEMNPTAKPLAKPAELRVIGMARMPRGNVAVESKIRPMIHARPSDK